MAPKHDFSGMAMLLARLGGTSASAIRLYNQWAVRYLAYTRRRYRTYAGGGGDWAPLAASTLARRRKGKGPGSAKILMDTGMLYGALTVGAPGSLLKYLKDGVRVGFGGPIRHTKGQSSGRATIADIARFHQRGGRHLPAREIIDWPDMQTLRGMYRDLERAVDA